MRTTAICNDRERMEGALGLLPAESAREAVDLALDSLNGLTCRELTTHMVG